MVETISSPAVGDVEDGEGFRRLTGREGERADSALEGRDALLQHVGGRVHDPGVDIAEFLEPEQAGRMLGAFEHVRGGLVDRHRPRVRGRIGILASVEGEVSNPCWFVASVSRRASISLSLMALCSFFASTTVPA